MRLPPALCLILLAVTAATSVARTGTGPGGYTWRDCEEPGGPACGYVLTASSDGFTGLCSDEIYGIPGGIGFSFPYYGMTFASLFVSANGLVYLSNPPGSDVTNLALTGLEGRPLIAPLWDDWAMDNDDAFEFLCPSPVGCSNSGPLTFVESFRLGSGVDASGVRYRDVEWFDTAKHRPTCSEPETVTFGLRLFEDGRILFNYLDASVGQPAETDGGISSTVGISRGFVGHFTQVGFDEVSIPYVPYAILFVPPCPTLSCGTITAPSDACEGDTVRFSISPTGGEAPLEVEWDFDGDTVPDATGNPVDRIVAAGPLTATATVRDSCADPAPQSCVVSHVLDVHANPVPIVTPQASTSFCGADGESVSLLADTGYASYQWTRDGFTVPGETTRLLITNVSGDHVVIVVDAFGCEGSSAPVAVDAEDCSAGCTPLSCDDVVVTPSPACEGTQVTLTAIVTGGEGAITVSWDLDGDGVPDVTGNPLRRVFLPGTTRVTAHVSDACSAPAAQSCTHPADVVVNPLPEPLVLADGPLSFCAARGESVTLDAGGGWATVQWLLDGAVIPGATGSVHVATVSGDHVATVTDAGGCTGASAPIRVDASDCPSPCSVLSCAGVTVTPAEACEGEEQELLLAFAGGEAPVGVAWDLDGDGIPDAAGNPVRVTLGPGTTRVRAVAADACSDPGPQSCDAFADAVVLPGPSHLGEVSGRGEPPLLVLSRAGRVEVEAEPAATAYHVYVDAIGSWWAPSDPTGRACALLPAGPGARPATIVLDSVLPPGSWMVVTAAHACGEGPAGTSSEGVDRATGSGWTPCGAAP